MDAVSDKQAALDRALSEATLAFAKFSLDVFTNDPAFQGGIDTDFGKLSLEKNLRASKAIVRESPEVNGPSRFSRRSLCAGMAFGAAATLLASSRAAAALPPPDAIQGAQILLGEASASKRMVLGVSLHCGGTRAYFREHGSRLAREVGRWRAPDPPHPHRAHST